MTKTSHRAAIFCARSSASCFSPLLKRTFSSSTISPGRTSTPPSQSFLSGTGTPTAAPDAWPPGRAKTLPSRCLPQVCQDATSPARGLLPSAPPECRQRRTDSRIAAHRPIFDRHVQIFPDQHALSLEIQTRHFYDFQGCPSQLASGGFRPSQGGIEHAVGKSPLIVVPRAHLHQGSLDNLGHSGIVSR